MAAPLIDRAWATERLRVRDAQPTDVPRLTAIFNACSYAGEWDDTFTVVPESDVAALAAKSAQARGGCSSEPFTLQCLCDTASDEIIGYYHLTYRRPLENQVGVSMLVLDPAHQGRGFGAEAVRGIVAGLEALRSYRALVAKVYLKNWPAMRFWIGMGFTTVLRYLGDPVMAEGAYASILLERPL
ncbi:MAG TPA: GNAT family N-acetyltransferase [Candidatus Kapabacteria bacterium]|nr:GNAT family N-acetyltransferase [Candidatus Kapabacteria bacterium]